MTTVLDVQGLEVDFEGQVAAVRGVSLQLNHGETHCLVGESGCGKSVTALSILRLLGRRARIRADRMAYRDIDLANLSRSNFAKLLGGRVAMIFQDPMTSLNPVYTIGSQMTEAYRRHRGATRAEAAARAEMLLARVGIPAPGMRLGQYPHQLSGGLRQRVMIAMALMCEPDVLIADEPTTALDVTVQAQILRLLHELQKEMGLALLLITHDLGVVARVAHRVSVMYAGEIVETGTTEAVLGHPDHPYTRALMTCIPVPGQLAPGEDLGSIPGTVPRLQPGFVGCAFRERCGYASAACEHAVPMRAATFGNIARCTLPPDWRPLAKAKSVA